MRNLILVKMRKKKTDKDVFSSIKNKHFSKAKNIVRDKVERKEIYAE